MIVERDEELRQFQNMWAREKQIKEETQEELADTQIKLKGVEADLENEKKRDRQKKRLLINKSWFSIHDLLTWRQRNKRLQKSTKLR